ncbi:hypothetical protein MKEN_00782800 [Mycena kentingensis (nom. inval.)]|nr:hypothetical protein MKEN_00782800 [Mycena kentingensis (nom. inval.)]
MENSLLDSLPYYDDDLERFPGLRSKVDREFTREGKPPTTLHPNVPPAISLFEKHPLLKAELERVESHQEFPRLDALRYQLPAPAAPGTDEDWQAALKNAEAQLEHQRTRQTNLQLLQTYGSNAWRIHNYLLESTVKQTEQALEQMKELTVEVNRERKNTQTRLGKELNSLETRWTELISNILQIELANAALDAEVNRLNSREAELASIQSKKFTSSNINKKFLEKTSSSSATSSAISHSAAAKAAAPVAQSTSTHSRLVAAKLTTAAQSLSPGPGWSRPSSATPPTSTTPAINGAGPADASTASAPSLAQSNSRSGRPRDNGGATNKPVWGNTTSSQQRPNVASQREFPTAAEVAAAPRKTRPTLADRNAASKEAVAAMELAAAANKQARMEEADTFRGVHLDPNAHHWDEMEEDDDNFLDGVLDFGDGRQYKIESTELPADNSSITLVAAESTNSIPSPPNSASRREEIHSNVPVSKEERFADDFDRSWPRSRSSPSLATRDLPIAAAGPSPVSPSMPHHSPQDPPGSRGMLFNERSNKLEPYNKAAVNPKRGGDGFTAPVESRGSGRGRGFVAPNDRQSRMPPPAAQSNMAPSRPPPNAWAQRSEENRGRQLSNMDPPPVPAPGSRQRPPHIPQPSMEAQRRTSTSRDSRKTPSEPPLSARRQPSQSPSLSHTSAVAQSPVAPITQLSTTELDEARKDVMQTAAARAKARRQQEEEERQKAQERARQKAAELEEKLKTSEAAKLKENSQVVEIIESAVKMASSQAVMPSAERSMLRRPSDVPAPMRRMSSSIVAPALTPVEGESSWRSKPSPIVPPPIPAQFRPPVQERSAPPAPTPTFIQPPTALDQLENAAEDLEVVDFSDMGKFVGVADEPAPVAISRSVRPSASDFFDDRPPASAVAIASPPIEKGPSNWRRQDPESRPSLGEHQRSSSSEVVASTSTSFPAEALAQTNRTPRKEAPISTLDDVMSRIKGAIDTMQTTERERERRSPEVSSTAPAPAARLPAPTFQLQTQAQPAPAPNRWIPPAFRPRPTQVAPAEPPEPRESITTGSEPPRSPKPAWNTFVTRLPKTSQALEPVNRKQLTMFGKATPFRWDILSFDPPMEGMSKRELSVNEVLFRKMPFKGGKGKFRVVLPARKVVVAPMVVPVNIPPPKAVKQQAVADTASTWRKAAPTPIAEPAGLDTMSRSPPPELASDLDKLETTKPSILVSSPPTGPLKPRLMPGPDAGMPSILASTDESTQPTEPWTRSSLGGKGPDPEHLKAVWSQSSNKAAAINSLEGIADDFTAIPFTLQDVKSEDGGTPPPTTTTTSRMSLHDVTRAFQQVPTSSSSTNSSSSSRPPISPPSTSAPVARPPPATTAPGAAPPGAAYPGPYGHPPHANGMMRTFTPFTPMPGSVLYQMAPSAMPGRMPMPVYNQHMWMPPPPPQTPGVMRPMPGSPYAPQLMAYPAPGPPNGAPMYPPPPGPGGQVNGAGRGRGVIGPHHQNPGMFPASPILMQIPPMPASYMALPGAGRGVPMQPQQQPGPGQPQQPPPPMHSPGFNAVPPASFTRPTW